MPRRIFMDQIHLTFFIAERLPRPALAALRRSLKEARFKIQLRRSVRRVLDRSTVLRQLRLVVSS